MVGQLLAECTAPGCSVQVPPAPLCIQPPPAGATADDGEAEGCLQHVYYQVPACLTIPTCGDGLCNPFEGQQEDSLSCPYDCHCGDGACDASERAGSLGRMAVAARQRRWLSAVCPAGCGQIDCSPSCHGPEWDEQGPCTAGRLQACTEARSVAVCWPSAGH